MVVGSGLMARAFQMQYADLRDIVIFASGVSNSKEIRSSEFEREQLLLQQHLNSGRLFVYFSTCSIYDPSQKMSPYVLHKLKMEELVKTIPNHFIFRTSNVVGRGGNDLLIFNFLIKQILAGKPYELWTKATRNFIDVDDVRSIVEIILQGKPPGQTLNIAHPNSYKVTTIVSSMEKFFGVASMHVSVDKGSPFTIDTTKISEVFPKLGILTDDSYIDTLLTKYFNKKAATGS